MGRALDRLMTGLAMIAAALVVAMVLGIAFEVVMRYVLNRPTRWVLEFSEYALVYIAFLGGPWVLLHESHVKVEFVVEAFSMPVQRAFHVVTSLVGAAVCGTVAWVSFTYVLDIYEKGEVLFRSIQAPKWLIIAVIPLGMSLLALQFVRRTFNEPPSGPGGGM